MICKTCGRENRSDAKYCDQCGNKIVVTILPGQRFIVIVTPGGYGDGFNEEYGPFITLDDAFDAMNSPSSRTINTKEMEFFLAEVSHMKLLPEDLSTNVDHRYKVHYWWKLDLVGETWILGSEVPNHPDSLGLSSLEWAPVKKDPKAS